MQLPAFFIFWYSDSMKILAIETSCDDTGVTLLETKGAGNFRVLADELANQAKLHSTYGGVYPNLAKNEHIKNLFWS